MSFVGVVTEKLSVFGVVCRSGGCVTHLLTVVCSSLLWYVRVYEQVCF